MEHVERIEPHQPQWKEWIGCHLHRYRFGSRFVAGQRVLDAGCGVGYGTRVLADAGASEIVAVDVSAEAVASAQKLFAHPRVHFVQDNCETLTNVQGPFDVVIALESLEHFHDVTSFLKQVHRLLAHDGVFICSTPNALITMPPGARRPVNPFHVKEYSPDEFKELLRACFGQVSLTGQHVTAAYILALRTSILWSNPFMRLGWLVQRLRGHRVPWTAPQIGTTEGDYIMSEANLERADVLVAVCRHPL
jgi:2-polyprenyl-3-methyl-5-hydroxy-6-metoxy-1,4-benzoquinol methylase